MNQKLWLVGIMVLQVCFLQAQNNKDTLVINPFRLGFNVLASTYQGDLNQSWEKFKPAFSINLLFEKGKKVQPQFNFTTGSVVGQDMNYNPKTQKYNNFVHTSFTMLDVRFLYRLQPKKRGSPYAGLGVGMMLFNPKDMYGNSLTEDRASRQTGEQYNSNAFTIPMVLGYRYYLNPYTSIHIEAQTYNPQTKYLDNINQLGTYKRNDKLFGIMIGLQLSPSQLVRKTIPKVIENPILAIRKGMLNRPALEENPTLSDNQSINIKTSGVSGVKGNVISLTYNEKLSFNVENAQKMQKVAQKIKDMPTKGAYITIVVSGNEDKTVLKAQAEAVFQVIKDNLLDNGVAVNKIYVLYDLKKVPNVAFSVNKIQLDVR